MLAQAQPTSCREESWGSEGCTAKVTQGTSVDPQQPFAPRSPHPKWASVPDSSKEVKIEHYWCL